MPDLRVCALQLLKINPKTYEAEKSVFWASCENLVSRSNAPHKQALRQAPCYLKPTKQAHVLIHSPHM